MPAKYRFSTPDNSDLIITADSFVGAAALADRAAGDVRYRGQVKPLRGAHRLSYFEYGLLAYIGVISTGGLVGSWRASSIHPLLASGLYLVLPLLVMLCLLKTIHEGGHVLAAITAPRKPGARRVRVNGIGLWVLTGFHVIVWARGRARFFRKNHPYVCLRVPAFDHRLRVRLAVGGPLATCVAGIAFGIGAIITAAGTHSLAYIGPAYFRTMSLGLSGVHYLYPGFWPTLFLIMSILCFGDSADNLMVLRVKDGNSIARSDGAHIRRALDLMRAAAMPVARITFSLWLIRVAAYVGVCGAGLLILHNSF